MEEMEEVQHDYQIDQQQFDKNSNDLKEDLIDHYIDKENWIPASPLVEEHTVQFMDLYVQPPMLQINKMDISGQTRSSTQFTQFTDTDSHTKVTSYNQLFFKETNEPLRNIYLTADAGMGKTSFAQKLSLTWCKAKRPDIFSSNFERDEVETMNGFDFVFLLHLREYQNTDTCNLGDMIFEMLSQRMSRRLIYSETLVKQVLQRKKCLIICDGLDEWYHPDACPKEPKIPHTNDLNSCTVLTTTRSWKLNAISLPTNKLDRFVIISKLDSETSKKLQTNAIHILYNITDERETQNYIADFNEKIASSELGEICLIPFILLQLLCQWFDKLPLGKSRCDIYSSVTEMTLSRGLKKKNVPKISPKPMPNLVLPRCLMQKEKCCIYINLLLSLGKLAFSMLLNLVKESRLLITNEQVLNYLTGNELDFFLKVGLLSQTVDNRIISKRVIGVHFQHKSVQEFYAALYIALKWETDALHIQVQQVCSSLIDILDMTDVFVLVSGMNRFLFLRIFNNLQEVLSQDTIIDSYRRKIEEDDWFSNEQAIWYYQLMQLSCLEESNRNEHEHQLISLQDVLLRSYELTCRPNNLKALKEITNFSRGSIQSLLVRWGVLHVKSSNADNFTSFIEEALQSDVFSSLQILKVNFLIIQKPVAYKLIEQARQLQCLTITGDNVRNDIGCHIPAITKLDALRLLSLSSFYISHCNIKRLMLYISNNLLLSQLRLKCIKCLEHDSEIKRRQHDFFKRDDCIRQSCIILNLSRLDNLSYLSLGDMHVSELHVNSSSLTKCCIDDTVVSNCNKIPLDLHAAPLLSSLVLRNFHHCLFQSPTPVPINQILSGLSQLKEIRLGNVWIRNNDLCITCEMTRLELINLTGVSITATAWRTLFNIVSNLPQCVTVEIVDCRIFSLDEKWRGIADEVRSISTFKMIKDLEEKDDEASLSLKHVPITPS